MGTEILLVYTITEDNKFRVLKPLLNHFQNKVQNFSCELMDVSSYPPELRKRINVFFFLNVQNLIGLKNKNLIGYLFLV